MRPEELAVALLLIICSSSIIQIAGAEDLYWEGEEDPSDEFLEVKADDPDIGGRIKRQVTDFFNNFWSPFTTSSTTTEAPKAEVVTDDPDMEEQEEELDHGSGQPDRVEPELGEKTLRVTFVVMEPYQTEFSNRDSTEFQNFSRSLADAVNVLYERLPGTQRASLVRIQSRVSNEFSCKVTLDIVTTGYDKTERITQLLQDHIRNNRKLGQVEVNDDDFSAHVIDPGLVTCAEDELRCGDDTCVPGSSRCNGFKDCYDGADEEDCPNFDWNSNTDQSGTSFDSARNISCYDNPLITISESQRCDGIRDCPLGDDEDGCGGGLPSPDNTTPGPETTITQQETLPETCPAGEFSCDDTRCVSFSARCDGFADCTDGTDEQGCEDNSETEEQVLPTLTPTCSPAASPRASPIDHGPVMLDMPTIIYPMAPSSSRKADPVEPLVNADSVEPGPSSAPDVGTMNSSNPEEEPELEDDILQILGDAPLPDQALGKNIHKDVAALWQDILLKGLTKEVKEPILKKYLVPANCNLLVAPILNPEAKAAVPDILAKRDTTLLQKQNQIGVALAALSQLSEMILRNETSKQVLLQPLSDACRILCDSHNIETKTRRSILMSSINTSLRDTLASAERDKYLFGQDLAEKLKAAKTVQKTGEIAQD